MEGKNKIVIFNGPPRSGKDTFADMLEEHYDVYNNGFFVYRDSFKDELIRLVLNYYEIDKREWNDRYEHSKEEPWDKLGGLSQREALIDMSEVKIKPLLGKDYFGKAAAQGLILYEDEDNNVGVFSDGGFEEEIHPIIDKVGIENVLIFRLHRPDHDFTGDSRGYLDIDGVTTIDIDSLEVDATFDVINKKFKEWVDNE